MLKIRYLTPKDYRVMPWKNHRGTTSQIAIWPETARFPEDAFLWRISTASIASSGPFSPFPGYDRTVVMIEGQEAELNHDVVDRPCKLTRLVPYSFRGEWETTCELTIEAIRDFGLMIRRDQAEATVSALKLSAQGFVETLEATTHLYYCVRGEIEMTIESSLPRRKVALRGDELLWIDNPLQERATLEARLISGPAELVQVEIRAQTYPTSQSVHSNS